MGQTDGAGQAAQPAPVIASSCTLWVRRNGPFLSRSVPQPALYLIYWESLSGA